ncbi:MAG: Rpn family recombination-promoting nuclease/putative transposase, partial [Holosporales bacterium]|nr:Rpn family recombination-promoting nuclease/putative transposase [Holosporales bacterium]
MTGLLDPTLDYIFKTIFGQEDRKHLLISFLNALLKGQPQIKDITLENTELAKILETDKASRLDIKATTGDGTKLDIEIQCKNTGEIPERAIYYTCKMVAGQKLAGSPYVDQKAISIWILGENVTSLEDPVNEAGLMYKPKRAHPLDMSDSIRIVFIELQKFDPKNADAKDMLTAWLSFLKDPVYMDKAFLDIDEVSTAMDTLKYISADDDVRAIA